MVSTISCCDDVMWQLNRTWSRTALLLPPLMRSQRDIGVIISSLISHQSSLPYFLTFFKDPFVYLYPISNSNSIPTTHQVLTCLIPTTHQVLACCLLNSSSYMPGFFIMIDRDLRFILSFTQYLCS